MKLYIILFCSEYGGGHGEGPYTKDVSHHPKAFIDKQQAESFGAYEAKKYAFCKHAVIEVELDALQHNTI